MDRHEKRRFMIFSEGGHFIASSGLLALTFLPNPPLVFIYMCMGLVGFFSSFENISASAYVQTLVPKAEFPRAAAWNLSFFQAAIIGGPLTAGWVLHHFNTRTAYSISVVCLSLSFLLATRLKKVAHLRWTPLFLPSPIGPVLNRASNSFGPNP